MRLAIMTWGESRNLLSAAAVALFFTLVTCSKSQAQGPIPEASMSAPAIEHPTAVVTIPDQPTREHYFWDTKNKLLFVAAAACNTADFAVTRSNLQSGGRELNPIVRVFGRSSSGLAVNFAGETAGTMALSYFFHKTGHHTLERFVPVINISASLGAVSYGLAHR